MHQQFKLINFFSQLAGVTYWTRFEKPLRDVEAERRQDEDRVIVMETELGDNSETKTSYDMSQTSIDYIIHKNSWEHPDLSQEGIFSNLRATSSSAITIKRVENRMYVLSTTDCFIY